MRLIKQFSFVAAGLAMALAGLAGGASAGSYDKVYADSFGNLIIHSPAGYKRIVVGQGHLAEELAAYSRAGAAPDVVYLEGEGRRDCARYGAFERGRGYMYGLPDNAAPVLVGPCR